MQTSVMGRAGESSLLELFLWHLLAVISMVIQVPFSTLAYVLWFSLPSRQEEQ
jgi:hypothetical protein